MCGLLYLAILAHTVGPVAESPDEPKGGFKHTDRPPPKKAKDEWRCERRARKCGHIEYVNVGPVPFGGRAPDREAEFALFWQLEAEENCIECKAGKTGPSLFIKPNRPPEAKPHG